MNSLIKNIIEWEIWQLLHQWMTWNLDSILKCIEIAQEAFHFNVTYVVF